MAGPVLRPSFESSYGYYGVAGPVLKQQLWPLHTWRGSRRGRRSFEICGGAYGVAGPVLIQHLWLLFTWKGSRRGSPVLKHQLWPLNIWNGGAGPVLKHHTWFSWLWVTILFRLIHSHFICTSKRCGACM